jgi:hypothetical protein
MLLAVAITASGYAYLTLSNELAWIAYISGPVLLFWVAGTGIWLTVRSRRAPDTAIGHPPTARRVARGRSPVVTPRSP